MNSVNFINFSQFLRVILPPAVKDESPCIVSVEEKKLKIFGNKKKIYVYRKKQIKTLKKAFNEKEKLKF
jgi:fructose/tagatose bisphosphate aldolase